MTNILTGQTAPDFSLKGLDGREYTLSELLTKGPVLAAFFKVSCPVCQFTFPFLERIYKGYGGPDLTILGISQDNAKATQGFTSEYGVTFPVVLDEKSYSASNAYGLTNVPTIFLIEPDGIVKMSSLGFNKEDLEAIARELASRQSLPPWNLFPPGKSIPAYKPG